MKKFFNLLACFLVLFTACNQGNTKQLNSSATRTTIELSEEMHDFGNIKQGEVIKYSISVKNTGQGELIIANVEASCGCTNVKFEKKPIAPKSSGEVEFTFDSRGMTGNVFKSLRIFSNATTEIKEFKFGAFVIPPSPQ